MVEIEESLPLAYLSVYRGFMYRYIVFKDPRLAIASPHMLDVFPVAVEYHEGPLVDGRPSDQVE